MHYATPRLRSPQGCSQTLWTQICTYRPVSIPLPPFHFRITNVFQPYGVVQNLLHYQLSLIEPTSALLIAFEAG
jgi:hypothetical protein